MFSEGESIMKILSAALLASLSLSAAACGPKVKSSFVTANGVRLHYLDWGGSGPTLILVHGYGENPHYFDDLAPAFTDRFRVLAYARRGEGESDAKGPYDVATLTEDLRGLMDELGISKADLAGHSMGGDELTAMAGTHPERVDRIVYLDAAYDWADPAFAAAYKALSPTSEYKADAPGAMKSLDALRAQLRTQWFLGVKDASRYDAYIQEGVVVQSDGSVRSRGNDTAAQALFTTLFRDRRDYTKIRSPTLAIYAASFPEVGDGDSSQLAISRPWEQQSMVPFRAASMERVRRELPNVEIVMNVPGNHTDFLYISRDQVVAAMRRFLLDSGPQR
jgi:pimeloyl-ACP methyl ester carboxylesterase